MIREIPMLFSPPMVAAILNNQKTKTRRTEGLETVNLHANDYRFMRWVRDEHNQRHTKFMRPGVEAPIVCTAKAFCKPGDLIWVKESFYQFGHWKQDGSTSTGKPKWEFVPWDDTVLFDDNKPSLFFPGNGPSDVDSPHGNHWYKRSSLFLKKGHARIWLEVAERKPERVQDISEEDAKAEGVEIVKRNALFDFYKSYTPDRECFNNPLSSFRTLWQFINGVESWLQNPWVWVISFKVLSTTGKANIRYGLN